MKKLILGLFILLIVAVGVVSYYVLTNLDEIVKQAIEKYGSQATQTAVRVDKVNINLKEGSGAIFGVSIANPGGFGEPNAFSLGEISTKIDYESVTREIIIIDDITILAPKVFFEMNKDKKTNLNELKNNITSSIPAGKPAAKEQPGETGGGKEPKLIIRHVKFAEGDIQATVVPLNNKTYQLKLPAIEMKDLGGKDGATPSEIAKQILNKLTDEAKNAVRKQGLDKELDKLKAQAQQKVDEEKARLKEQADSKLETEKKKVQDKLKGLLGK